MTYSEFLKKRAKEFWERAKEDFEKLRFKTKFRDSLSLPPMLLYSSRRSLMKSLYKIIADKNKQAERYFHNTLFYVKEIKNMLQESLSDVKVLIFGSVVRGNYKPNSDIDILVISSLMPEGPFAQAEFKLRIKEQFPDAPFEIHLITPAEYNSWYKNFIKDEFIEV